MRRPLVAGNWKMHCGPTEARSLALGIRNGLLGSRAPVDVLLCPPFVSLAAVREIVQGSEIRLGAQNLFWAASGAWTGEVSAGMLVDAGCTSVLVGHSERRQHFGDDDQSVHRRLRAALDAGLQVIACVGESLAERQAQRTTQVVESQVRHGLPGLSTEEWKRVTLAYEPVWAIGTGHNATPEQAQEVHSTLRRLVETLSGAEVARQIRILYGGSVKPENAAALLGQTDVDGALVGGASLDARAFLGIVAAARATS